MSVAATTLDSFVWGDPRVWRLAQLAAYPDGIYSAVARLGHLWARCTYLGTDVPDEAEIRACLGPSGVEDLIESTLGERLDDGTVRVRGGITEDGKDRLGWYRERHPAPTRATGTDARSRGGKSRVNAPRIGGRFVKSTTDSAGTSSTSSAGENSTSSTSSAGASGSGSGSEEERSPARVGGAGPAGTSSTSSAGPPAQPAGAIAGGVRLPTADVWTYAQSKHFELRTSGIDPHAQVWSAMPSGSGADDLRDRMRELAEQGKTTDQIRAACLHVIDVRAAESRAFSPPHLRFFIASRMFTKEAFSKALELSPAQVAAQAAQKNGAPRGQPPRAAEPPRPRSAPLKPC
jgi:hypothetical protein